MMITRRLILSATLIAVCVPLLLALSSAMFPAGAMFPAESLTGVSTWPSATAHAEDDEDDDTPQLAKVLVQLKKRKKDAEKGVYPIKPLERGFKGKWNLRLGPSPEFHGITSAKLAELPAGKLHVLAMRIEGQENEMGSMNPPQLIKIQMIIAGDYDPPELTPEQKKLRVKWHSGRLRRQEDQPGKHYLGMAKIEAPGHRQIHVIGEAEPSVLERGAYLVVEGLKDEESKPRELLCSRVTVIDPSFVKDKSYKTILGLP